MVAAGLAVPTAAQASSMTLYDNYQGKGVAEDAALSSVAWTLAVEDNCATCSVLLTAAFTGSQNYYSGTYLDSVQWVIAQPDVTPLDAGYRGFYVDGALNGGWSSDWSFALHQSLNANQCNGHSNASDAVCGEWVGGGAAGGYGPIASGLVLAWSFETVFSGELTAMTAGNVRGAFNTSSGKNFNIFSPGGGTAVGGGCAEIGGCLPTVPELPGIPEQPPAAPAVVPEPATLFLFGSGLFAVSIAARRMKRGSPNAPAE